MTEVTMTEVTMTEVIGIDHIYIAVSDLARSEIFYYRVLLYIGSEVVASEPALGESGAQAPECTQQYMRMPSTARPRCRFAQSTYVPVYRHTGFSQEHFALGGEPHIQYYNRHFGYVLRPSGTKAIPDARSPGLHHLCLRVDTTADVAAVTAQLREKGIDATDAILYPVYAPDYWATYFTDPDGIRLEVTNYRQERRERHDNW